MHLSEFGKEYLLLALRIDKLIDGYTEAYFGPPALQQAVSGEDPKSPDVLLNSCISLQQKLKDQGFEEDRKRFLERMLHAIRTRLELENGAKIPYLEQIKRIYDITPKLIEDSFWFKLKAELEDLLGGSDTLINQIKVIMKMHELPKEKTETSYNIALKIVREKTYELFPNLLPSGEGVSIAIVKDQPWSAYNWYLGEFKSRIDINTDLPVRWNNILHLSAHEAYPGHHTEHSIKDNLLYHQKNRFEHSIILVQTPEAVICEGIANTALDVLFSPSESLEIGLEYLCPNKKEEDVETLLKMKKLYSPFNAFSGNLAIYAHVNGWSDEELIKYAMQFEFYPEKQFRHTLKFIRDPLWSTFTFTYSFGERLIKAKYGERPSPKDFTTLLTQPILPSDLK